MNIISGHRVLQYPQETAKRQFSIALTHHWRGALFIASIAALIILLAALVQSHYRPGSYNYYISENRLWSVISCQGQLYWVDYHFLNENVDFTRVQLNGLNLLCGMGFNTHAESEPSGRGVGTRTKTSTVSGGFTDKPLSSGVLPQWINEYSPPQVLNNPHVDSFPASRWLEFRVPYWCLLMPAVAVALLTGNAVRSTTHRRQRLRAGLCPHCGYDLRASKDRCPECGQAILPDQR